VGHKSIGIYTVIERADGKAVREDDAEPELLDDESIPFGDSGGPILLIALR
jgi:hypothetical protein